METEHARAVLQHYLARWMKASIRVSGEDTTELEEEINLLNADLETAQEQIAGYQSRIKLLEDEKIESNKKESYTNFGLGVSEYGIGLETAASKRRGLRK